MKYAPQTAQGRFIATGMKLFDLRQKINRALAPNMAMVIWGGDRFAAKPISRNADGSWLMEANEHTARTVPGTRFNIQPGQIVAMPETSEAKTDAAVPTVTSSAKAAPMSSRLSEKAKLVAAGQKSLLTKVEAQFDAMLEAQAKSAERLNGAMQKITAVQADIEAGTSTIEDVANQLTNQG